MRASTIIIQRKWRATLSGRIAHEHFLMIKVGAAPKNSSFAKNYFRKENKMNYFFVSYTFILNMPLQSIKNYISS